MERPYVLPKDACTNFVFPDIAHTLYLEIVEST